jgi:hypothetical protein
LNSLLTYLTGSHVKTGLQGSQETINVDDLDDAGDGTILSPVMDLAVSVFALQNVANALVMESASIWGVRGHWWHIHQ